jgi:MoxR-like ATPase
MEILIAPPSDAADLDAVVFDPRFHDPDRLVVSAPAAVLPYQ